MRKKNWWIEKYNHCLHGPKPSSSPSNFLVALAWVHKPCCVCDLCHVVCKQSACKYTFKQWLYFRRGSRLRQIEFVFKVRLCHKVWRQNTLMILYQSRKKPKIHFLLFFKAIWIFAPKIKFNQIFQDRFFFTKQKWWFAFVWLLDTWDVLRPKCVVACRPVGKEFVKQRDVELSNCTTMKKWFPLLLVHFVQF